MELEIVSHCWQYSRLLTYQLSSLVLFPPDNVNVTMTVFFNGEDKKTSTVLDYFGDMSVQNIRWNWRELDKTHLFRRAIGRNIAALETKADWVFFTDCDYLFRENCLDSLEQIMTLQDIPLVFPRLVYNTPQIDSYDPLFSKDNEKPVVIDIDPGRFEPVTFKRAIGGVQIACADVVRQIGYCKNVPRFMKPADRFQRCKEDVVFRRIIGSDGYPLDIPGVYRISHKYKGRCWLSWQKPF